MNEKIINEALTHYLECCYAKLADRRRLALGVTAIEEKIEAIEEELKRL